MKHHKTKMQAVKVCFKETCDKCGKDITGGFGEDYYDFTFSFRKGENYPDYQDYTISTLDLCRECSDQLVSNMEDQGYVFQVEEIQN